ncbi:site-specific tyrosine recombinase XerC [Pseudooceanicola marinus]|uniref:Site-specific tyrosine recombinase XerC n=1 Tax=Pseudooceanicola marinus TaxID=396013 RepID=A0A1X6YRY2_9RHOB|nr:tyrosine-type recombinase/integrase [Pseudooceanicola marinus]PJE26048.1 integrase [Pseudooceanicola marinus]SLN28866.1 site-specific tyrosine recombinase XerC [Pseudooceanicola marinus]
MKRPDLPYLEFKTVKGREYIYFRKGKYRRRLPSNPDSEEFSIEYWATRNGQRKRQVKTTWHALITSYFQSANYRSLSKGSKANYRRHCEEIREKNGDKDMRAFRRKHALAARDALQDTWSKANERVAVLSILCKHAVDLEWIERNPVEGIEKLKGGEYAPWPDEALSAFTKLCEEKNLNLARTAFELAIGTGQRLGDCIKMKWSDLDGEYIRVTQEKTGADLWIYCPTRLRQYLDELPRMGDYILANGSSGPVGKRQIQKAIQTVREEIGAMHGSGRLVPHGWRYTAAVQLSEAGCSDAEIQAVTGHKTLAMVQKYRAKASQKRASKAAQKRREEWQEDP